MSNDNHKKSRLDSQGSFFYNLAKQAKWTDQQVMDLFQKRFQVDHWNALCQKDRKQAISIIKHYVKKQAEARDKKLRQSINAIWIKAGYSREELYCLISLWGFGNSLRALKYKDLCSVLGNVKKALITDAYIENRNYTFKE
jgi:hypothetical protein